VPCVNGGVGEFVRRQADNRAVFLVKLVYFSGESATEEIVGLWEARDLPEERTGVFGEGMDADVVDDDAEEYVCNCDDNSPDR
jgi:hypothetical protein